MGSPGRRLPTENDLPASPEQVAGLMRELIREVQAFSTASARAQGLNHTDLIVLIQLVALGGLGHGELAQAVGITRSSMTDLADRLERRGLLGRDRPENNRRAVILRPTARGRRLVEKVLAPALANVQELAASLEQRRHLPAVANFLSGAIEEISRARPTDGA